MFDRRLLLIDIGGGSTEILVGERGETLAAGSLKLGAIRLTGRFFRGDRLHPGAVDALPAPRALGLLAPMVREVERLGFEVAIGSLGHRRDRGRDGPGRAGASEPRPQPTTNFVLTAAEIRRPSSRPRRRADTWPSGAGSPGSTPTGPTSSWAAPSCSSRWWPRSASTS